MRVRIVRPVVSVHGTFQPGQVANLPDETARVWMRKGVAMQDKSLDGAGETKARPEVIKEGMFWCGKCQSLHRLVSPKGIKHHKYLVE